MAGSGDTIREALKTLYETGRDSMQRAKAEAAALDALDALEQENARLRTVADTVWIRDPSGNVVGPDVWIDGKPYEGTPLFDFAEARAVAAEKETATLRAAASAFDNTLSAWCDGPERDALRAALAAGPGEPG